ncbi:MAG TPA: hypothetical protein VL024_05870, partial [Castellaniella sp.]|nr:hypothetical protein [Castellaniella sp.]
KAKLGWFDQPGTLLASNPPCPGDGNWDGKVDAKDLANWRQVANGWGQSSVYDFGTSAPPAPGDVPEWVDPAQTLDGLTNNTDEAIIQSKLGFTCERSYTIH